MQTSAVLKGSSDLGGAHTDGRTDRRTDRQTHTMFDKKEGEAVRQLPSFVVW